MSRKEEDFEKLERTNAKLLAALKLAEWGTEELCADCSQFSGDGHIRSCRVRDAIQAATS